jgi:hypothetical protein
VCEERGIPLSVFRGLWEEYRETHMFDGRFFHRLEIPNINETDNVKRVKKAIKEYHANGQRVRVQGMTKADNKDVRQIHKVPNTSFYNALKWEADNSTCKWDGDRIRQRGKVSLLTYEMETELLYWVAVSQKHSGGVDGRAVCRVGFALMASNLEHYDHVKRVPFNPHYLYDHVKRVPFNPHYLPLYRLTRPISPKQSFPSSLHVRVTLLWSCWLCFKRKHGVGK